MFTFLFSNCSSVCLLKVFRQAASSHQIMWKMSSLTWLTWAMLWKMKRISSSKLLYLNWSGSISETKSLHCLFHWQANTSLCVLTHVINRACLGSVLCYEALLCFDSACIFADSICMLSTIITRVGRCLPNWHVTMMSACPLSVAVGSSCILARCCFPLETISRYHWHASLCQV